MILSKWVVELSSKQSTGGALTMSTHALKDHNNLL